MEILVSKRHSLPSFGIVAGSLDMTLSVECWELTLKDLCRREGAIYVDAWDHFDGKDGLRMNSVGKAILGRVLDEGVIKELEKKKTQIQGGESPPRQFLVVAVVRSGGERNCG